MTTSPSAAHHTIFVDLDNPPASVQLNIGDEIALVCKSAAGAPFISAVNVPTSELALAPNMFLMVPLALIRLPNQPAHTQLVHHGVAQATGSGQITFSKTSANPSQPGGSNHTLPYTVV